MTSDFKAEEIVCDILKELSRGESISITSWAQATGISKNSLSRRFKEVIDKFYTDDIVYDTKSKRWIAKRSYFLENSFIQPEDAVILNGISRNSDHFGMGLRRKVHMLVNKYTKRGHLAALQPEIIENIESMNQHLARLENAIKSRRKVILRYRNREKVLLPIRIINMEYYWYILGVTEKKTEEGEIKKDIRYFRMKIIEEVEFLEEYATYSEYRANYNKLKNIDKGMNAFFKPYIEPKKVKVLIPEWFEGYILDVPYFSLWEKTGSFIQIEETKHFYYKIPSTDEEYRDIVPAIQKYMPHIVICNIKENQEIIDIMRKRSEEYARIFEASTPQD